MKELKLVAVIVGFLAVIVFAASAHAQDRVVIGDQEIPPNVVLAIEALRPVVQPPAKLAAPRIMIDVAYIFGTVAMSTAGNNNTSGENKWDVKGVNIEGRVRLTDIATLGYNQIHTDLTNGRGRYEDLTGVQTYALNLHVSGETNYRELYGSFKIPNSHDHSLVVGLAKNEVVDLSHFTNQSYSGIDPAGNPIFYYEQGLTRATRTHVGLVVGGEGNHDWSPLMVAYSGRYYPWLSRNDRQEFSIGGQKPFDNDTRSSGLVLAGSATWFVDQHHHAGLNGGVKYVRFHTTPLEEMFSPTADVQSYWTPTVGLHVQF